MTESQTNASRIRELNATIRYAMWSVFRVADRLGPAPREDVAAEAEALLEQLTVKDVVARSWPASRPATTSRVPVRALLRVVPAARQRAA